jgi:shikimate 5-dehydrogenase
VQDNLIAEKEIVASAMYEARKVSQELQKEKEATLVIVQEARQKHKELQDCLERESSRVLTALVIAQKERDAASQAASEATSSAMKAREVLAEILDTYNLEMAKVRHVSLQLQVQHIYMYIFMC